MRDPGTDAGTLHIQVVRPNRSVDVTFEVLPGEVTAIVGPSGAGKTTVLRAIAGLDEPHQGRISLGTDVWDDAGRRLAAPAARRVGLVLAQPSLLPHLDIATNVAIAIDAGRAAAASIEEARQILTAVGLGEKADRLPGKLSTGEAQRVSLARALASRPQVMLLDEPLSNLDVGTRADMRRMLRHSLARFGGPSLIVSHDPVDAFSIADRIVVIEDGAVTHDGEMSTVVRRPRSSWAARLAGLNLFRGDIDRDGLHVAGTDHVLRVISDIRGKAIATVSPRSVALHRARPSGSPRNVWHGGVSSIEAYEGRVRVAVAGSLPIVAEVSPESVHDLTLGDGGGVWVSIKATDLEVYPA